MPFGHGDGGGGPTREHLEFLRRLGNLEGVPRVRHVGTGRVLPRAGQHAAELPRYAGELYFQAHRGTYTSQARTKRATA